MLKRAHAYINETRIKKERPKTKGMGQGYRKKMSGGIE